MDADDAFGRALVHHGDVADLVVFSKKNQIPGFHLIQRDFFSLLALQVGGRRNGNVSLQENILSEAGAIKARLRSSARVFVRCIQVAFCFIDDAVAVAHSGLAIRRRRLVGLNSIRGGGPAGRGR